MNPTLIKATIGSLSIAGLATCSYYGFQALNAEKTSNVKDILKNQKYTVLTNSNSNISTVIQKYKASVNANLKFENFDGNPSGGKSDSELLLEKCNSIFENKEISNKTVIEKARRWCVEPITILSLLGRSNITTLKTTDNDDTEAWDSKIKSYIDSKNSSKPKISGLTLSDYSDSNKTERIKNIKSKCQELSGKYNYEDKFEENLEIFKLWCSNN